MHRPTQPTADGTSMAGTVTIGLIGCTAYPDFGHNSQKQGQMPTYYVGDLLVIPVNFQ
jgi:hypothetical protein